jgi:hypothetical protein
MDEFVDNLVDCISKGVVYYTNPPQGGTSTGEKRMSVKFSADA